MTDKTRTGLKTGHYNGKKPSWGAAVLRPYKKHREIPAWNLRYWGEEGCITAVETSAEMRERASTKASKSARRLR